MFGNSCSEWTVAGLVKAAWVAVLAVVLSASAWGQPANKADGRASYESGGSSRGKLTNKSPSQLRDGSSGGAGNISLSASLDESLFSGMQWRLVGPFRGGRALAVTGVPGDPTTYYFGAVAGGVWKSTDAGNNWVPVFDHEKIASIGAIAVADSDHNIIYVGTGEGCIRGNMAYGDGVYKSTDGGKTWKNVGLRDSQHIGALVIDRKNPDIVLVAALGHAYGPNSERGIFRTIDGGKTWEKVLYRDDKTGGIDVVFDPGNSSILYASLWQVMRTPYSLTSGGEGSGLYKSTDGGATWKKLEGNGLPDGIMGRIGVTVSGGDSSRVYALIEAEKGGIYRSDNAGQDWTLINSDERYRQRAWYFTHIFADPKDVDTVYVLNTGAFRSRDGGKSFDLLPAPHGDHHGLWIDPTNPQRLINGNDGGVTISVDGGKSWSRQDNQPTAQFYHVIADNRWPYYIYGAQQDNSTVGIATYDDEGVIGRQDWYPVGGGESGYIAPDLDDPNIVYAGSDAGTISRFDKRTEQVVDFSPYPLDVSGNGAESLKHRFQWTEPVLVSHYDSNTLYTAAEVVFKSSNRGVTWTPISPDLTRNDKSKQKPSGGPITLDITSVEYYDTVFALSESPIKKGLLWAGTDDGLIQLTQDDGKSWQNVTPKELPEWSMISIIEASPNDAGTAYVAVDRHKLDDLQPYIYKTADFGKSWTRINSGIPMGAFVHSVRQDPKRKDLLFAGTELGMYVSFNDGVWWQPLQLNLPVTPVSDLIIKDNDLAISTNGRAFWILDDISPLREVTRDLANADLHLYKPAPAIRIYAPESIDKRRPMGQNPPPGAVIDYFLESAPKEDEEVTLAIYDANGKLIRKFSNLKKEKTEQPPEWPDLMKPVELIPAKAGMNRFVWNFRYESPVEIPGAFYGGDNGPEGPVALPGRYQVKITAKGASQTAPLEIILDPRVRISAEDLQKNFDLAIKTRERITELHTTVNEIRDLQAQLAILKKRAADSKAALDAVDALGKKIEPVEGLLIQVKMKSSEGNLRYPNMLNEQYDSFAHEFEGDAAPNDQLLQVYDDLNQRLQTQLALWRGIMQHDVPALNDFIRSQNIPAVNLDGK